MMRAIIIVIFLVLGVSCKDKKRNVPITEINRTNNQVSTLNKKNTSLIDYKKWTQHRNFEYILRETKDSIIVGDYQTNGIVISFISKDTLLFANNFDGWFFKINEIKNLSNTAFKVSVTSFNNIKENKDFSMSLINQKDSIWEINTFKNNFYAINNIEKLHFILTRNLKFTNIINTEKLEDPEIYLEEPDSIQYYYKLKNIF